MAAQKAKGLTRKVTKKRALSYDRMAPNARGVTALSEVNGPGAYERRYARTRAMLENEDPRMAKSKTWEGKLYRQQINKGRSPAQARATVRMVKGMKAKEAAERRSKAPKRKASKRKAAPRRKAAPKRSGTKGMTPNLRKAGQTVRKGDYIAAQRRKGRTAKQAEADWKLASGYYKKAKARKRKGRTYGKGKYRAMKARVGRGQKARQKYTYFYKTKKGNVREIPDHALLGFGSAQEMAQVFRTGTEAERLRLGNKMLKLLERRERAAKKAEDRALRGSAWFSPNPGDEVLSFEEWNKMKPNARKKTVKKKTTKRPTKAAFIRRMKRKGRSQKQAQAAWDLAYGKHRSKAAPKRRKAAPKRKRAAAPKRARRKAAPKRKGKLRKGTKAYKSRIRNLKKGCAKVRRMKANSRGGFVRSQMAKGRTRKQAEATWRMTHRKSKPSSRKRSGTKRRKSYKANVAGAAYKQELMNAFKYGAIVTAGFVAHRVLTNLADTYLTSRVEMIAKSDWRKTITGLLVAAIGVPVTIRVLPRNAGVAAAGMGASLLYQAILTALQKANQPKLLSAISAYPNAEGYPQYSGMGSYYEFQPHQVYGGMGEYYETQYTPGLEQAAAGMGMVGEGQVLTQAAAGLQQMYANGTGEYFAYGSEGIGEYESAPVASDNGYIDDGIQPNVHSAEQMLDVAEAAAGIGAYDQVLAQAAAGFGGDVPLQQTVTPMIRAMDIPDQPGGSRAGILAGGDGIFG